VFVGSYSTSAYARWAGRQSTDGPTRCGFALPGRRRKGTAQGVPCAALCTCPTQGSRIVGEDAGSGRSDGYWCAEPGLTTMRTMMASRATAAR
jgi:hypothetical protein